MFRLLLTLLYIWPMLHVGLSRRVAGNTKLGWFVLMFLFSWLAYPFFLFMTRQNTKAGN